LPTKIEILNEFNKSRLIDIANHFNVKINNSWNKSTIADTLERSKKVTIASLKILLNKEGEVSSVIKDEKSTFMDETAFAAFKYRDSCIIELANIVALSELKNGTALKNLEMWLSGCDNLRVLTQKDIPPNVKKQLSGKQIGAYYNSIKAMNSTKRTISDTLAEAKKSSIVQVHWYIERSPLPEKVKYYLISAYKCYVIECYDASVIMLARCIEFSLKSYLDSHSIVHPKKSTLGPLLELYRKKTNNHQIAEKIIEVQTMDRNICAHDRKQFWKAGKKEADHAWSAIIIILRDLLNFDLKMQLDISL